MAQLSENGELFSSPDTGVEKTNDLVTKSDEQVATYNPSTSDGIHTIFSEHVDRAKLDVLDDATRNDEKFKNEFKNELKEATLKLAQVERAKADAEKAKAELAEKNVQYEKELVETKQQLNIYQQAADSWDNKQKARQFHYDGVKDVMVCIGVKTPMCIPLLYALFPIALVFFLLKSFFVATFGNLACGAMDSDRPKAMKGFLWTLLVFFVILAIAACVWLFLTKVVGVKLW